MTNFCEKHGEQNFVGFRAHTKCSLSNLHDCGGQAPRCIVCLSETAFKDTRHAWPIMTKIKSKPIKRLAKCGRGYNFKDGYGFIRRVKEND